MDLRNILKKELEKSGGKARLVKVPANRRPTAESLRELDREISSQIEANEAMRKRSVEKASKYVCR